MKYVCFLFFTTFSFVEGATFPHFLVIACLHADPNWLFRKRLNPIIYRISKLWECLKDFTRCHIFKPERPSSLWVSFPFYCLSYFSIWAAFSLPNLTHQCLVCLASRWCSKLFSQQLQCPGHPASVCGVQVPGVSRCGPLQQCRWRQLHTGKNNVCNCHFYGHVLCCARILP